VLDTNILLRALINSSSASGKILALCDRRQIVPVISKPLVREHRYVLTHPSVNVRYPQLTPDVVEVALARLVYVGDVLRNVNVRFIYPRDPKDSKLIEAALAGAATHLLTYDSDLLDLPSGHDDASKRFRQRLPRLIVLKPEVFLMNSVKTSYADKGG
jgi:putative PIN family toxin of toxin-antitoxin system